MARPKRTVLEYRSYELPSDFPVMVLTGDRWHISPIPGKHLHFHNCLEIGLCHSDGGTMIFDRQKVHFTAGDVTCIARNVPHTTWSDPGNGSLWSYLFLDPVALLGNAALSRIPGLPDIRRFLTDCHLLLTGEQSAWAAELIQAVIDEMTRGKPGYQSCVRGLCTALLTLLLRHYGAEGDQSSCDPYIQALAPAFNYIHEHYMQEFPQETLAAACHLSPTHFRRLFREQTGTSPLAFLHQTRILKSCALLRSSEYSVTTIAGMVGYNSMTSYNRHFSKAMGCTPSVWRKTAGNQLRPSLLTFTGWTEAEVIEEGAEEPGGGKTPTASQT